MDKMSDSMSIIRCEWAGNDPLYQVYHDTEWGQPSHDDRHLFEMLCLEGAQAGLSWITILRKRTCYQELFCQFDPVKVALLTDEELEQFLLNPGIVRNRLKVYGFRKNALAYLKIQELFSSFDTYLWQFVQGTPIQNHWQSLKELPVSTPISDALSKDLKKRGFTFVGSTICYAYMQAIGMVNDHTTYCHCYRNKMIELSKE